MDNSNLLEWMKSIYKVIVDRNIEWRELHANNMKMNPLEGYYFYMFTPEINGNGVEMLKFTIHFMSRCDIKGISHPEEGVKYYVLHSFKEKYKEKFVIPEPIDFFALGSIGNIVNDYGRFRYIFDDLETATEVAYSELRQMIYPYTYILSEEECNEWNQFIDSFKGK